MSLMPDTSSSSRLPERATYLILLACGTVIVGVLALYQPRQATGIAVYRMPSQYVQTTTRSASQLSSFAYQAKPLNQRSSPSNRFSLSINGHRGSQLLEDPNTLAGAFLIASSALSYHWLPWTAIALAGAAVAALLKQSQQPPFQFQPAAHSSSAYGSTYSMASADFEPATTFRMQQTRLLSGESGSTSSQPGGPRGPPESEPSDYVSKRAAQFQVLVQDLLQQAVRTGPAGARRTLQAANAVIDTAREFIRGGATEAPPVVLRKLFERLGSTYIKLGQFIASSPSLFPAEYVKEFQKCLDSTPPVPWSTIRNIIERDLGRSIDEVFEYIDRTPLATASIAQVHAAVLKGSRQEVVVKVLKPGVEDVLDVDLTFLTSAAKVLEFLNPRFARVSLVDILSDIRKSMLEEVDFTIEAQNIKEFLNYLDSNSIGVATAPFVYTSASSKKVLTMERLRGAPLVDLKSIQAVTTADPETVLINALNVWLGSVLACRSFHADVHAGNLLVLPDGRVGFIDFGIVGRISPITFKSVERFLISLSRQDYDMMAKALVTMGATGYDFSQESTTTEVDLEEFAADLKKLFDGLLNLDPELVVLGATDRRTGQTVVTSTVTFDQDEITNILVDLVQVTEKHGLRLPREFVLLVKQILYFDRYVQALAPDLQVLNDDRVRLAQTAFYDV